MLVRATRFAAIDFESAGAARGRADVPVQIGLATWSLAEGYGRHFVSYLRTDQPITWQAHKVHGITPGDLAGAPSLVQLWPEVKERAGDAALVAHGKGTERRFLRAFPGHGFGPWIDTLLLARAAWPALPDHSLGRLCQEFELAKHVCSLVPDRTWHDALFDAVASLVLLEHVINTFHLTDSPLDDFVAPDVSRWHRLRR
jgi:DNA polymerase-3 subunit epsilon